MKILASDVGGTHIRLALVQEKDGILSVSNHETLKSTDFPVFDDAIKLYRQRHADDFDFASFSIAAPILNGQAKFPNRPWLLHIDKLRHLLGKTVYLLNDLQSQAYGLNDISAAEKEVITAGAPDEDGNWALVAPGTGLGQAMIYRGHEDEYFVMKSEGGHATFGAATPLQWELVRHLEKEFGHVSWEAVLSGPGVYRIYQFLRSYTGQEESMVLLDQMREGDPSAVVTRAGIAKQSELAAQACELFVELLARFAGDLALNAFATGGLFIGGGIAPHLLPLLKQPVFLRTFSRKGRMSGLLESVPITLVRSDMLGILGAARYAQMKTRHDNKVLSIRRES